MRKKIYEVVRQTVQQSFFEYFTVVLYYIGITVTAIWLFINIGVSQKIHPLYFQLINGERNAVVTFLKDIQSLPEYSKLLSINKILYGEEIEMEVNSDYFKRRERIEAMEALLKQNPKARDVLYRLSQLYKIQGDQLKATFYSEKAKEIDPAIKD